MQVLGFLMKCTLKLLHLNDILKSLSTNSRMLLLLESFFEVKKKVGRFCLKNSTAGGLLSFHFNLLEEKIKHSCSHFFRYQLNQASLALLL